MPALMRLIGAVALGSQSLIVGFRVVNQARRAECTDDDNKIKRLAKQQYGVDVSGCRDGRIQAQCANPQVQQTCCVSCGRTPAPSPPSPSPPPWTAPGTPPMSMPPADDSRPLHLYWMGGQSECLGQGNTQELLRNEAPSGFDYSAFEGKQQDVWLAGLASTAVNSFFVAPMEAGLGQGRGGARFGPELAFGQRIQELTGARVMVIKYAKGGSNVHVQWNPTHAENAWDYEASNASAAYLLETSTSPIPTTTKFGLFKTHTYLVRRTLEALEAAGVAYEWKGIVWSQGSADDRFPIQTFAEDTVRLFAAIRQQVVHDDALPILDEGADARHRLKTGKALVASMAGHVVQVENAMATQNHTDPCNPGPSNPCPGASFYNADFWNAYGWDSGMPADSLPTNANGKKSAWLVDFAGSPPNLHMTYEGMIRRGWSFANAFVRNFVEGGENLLTQDMRAEDPTIAFPSRECAAGENPSPVNHCWINCLDRPWVCAKWGS